jgi:FkbM family methyltransferase
MVLHMAAATARRLGLGGLAESSKTLARRLPLRYHSRWQGLQFYGSWKHRVHLVAIAQHRVEPLTVARFASAVRRGATVVDVGAYLGLYTLIAAREVGPNGRVIAIEPDPAAFDHLARSVARNGFASRVELLNAAASDEPGLLPLDQDREGPSTTTTVSGDGFLVQAIRLDDLGVTPTTVKMDVEGAEPAVIRGFTGLAGVDDLFVECNAQALRLGGHSPEKLVSLIRGAGLGEIVVIDEFENLITSWPVATDSPFVNLHCTPSCDA